MSEIKGYKCPNCGSMIPIPRSGRIFKCEHCGSEYEKENDYLYPIKIEVCNAKLVTLECRKSIPDEYMRGDIKEAVIEHTLNSIAHELAKSIVPFMEIKSYKDICNLTTVIGGRIKIADMRGREE